MSFSDSAIMRSRLADKTFLARFGAQREQLLRQYKNANIRPGDHCAELRRLLLMPQRHLSIDMAGALEAVDIEGLAVFAETLLPKLEAEILATGNATASDALGLARDMFEGTVFAAHSASERPKHPALPVVKVPIGTTLWLEGSPDMTNRNVAIEYYWQIGAMQDMRQTVTLDLLDALMQEPLFDALRTKQQIGYTVSCMARCTQLVSGYSVWVLSSKFGPAEIGDRIEAFLSDFKAQLQKMSADDFERHVTSLACMKLEPDRTLDMIQQTAWEELQERQYVFDRARMEATALASVTKADVLDTLDKFLLRGAPQRRLVIVSAIGGQAKRSDGKSVQVDNERAALTERYPGCAVVSSRADYLLHANFIDTPL